MDRLDFWLKIGFGALAAFWGGLAPMVQLLAIFMALDIASGVFASYKAKKLSSDVSREGMTKKVMIVILVMLGAALDVYAKPLNLPVSATDGIAGFYALNEGLSILENAGRAGAPIPPFLREALTKLSGQSATIVGTARRPK